MGQPEQGQVLPGQGLHVGGCHDEAAGRDHGLGGGAL